MAVKYTFFEAHVDASSIKVLNFSLTMLQKVGKEIVFEVKPELFALRALNDIKSSFVLVEFTPAFFDSLIVEEESFSCKLPAKPLTMIMRNLKNLRTLIIRAERREEEHLLSFQFVLKNDIIRNYNFCYEDCEILTPLFDETTCSTMKMAPTMFSKLLDHIHRSPEVLMTAKANRFSVQSYHKQDVVQAAELQKSVMQTGLTIRVSEFPEYTYHSLREVESMVFVIKEVAAFVAFCQALDLTFFSFFYSSGGRPIRFQVDQEFFHASLTMATVSTGQVAEPQQQEEDVEQEVEGAEYMERDGNNAQLRRDNTSEDDNRNLLTSERLQKQQRDFTIQSAFLASSSQINVDPLLADKVQNPTASISAPTDEIRSESTVMQGTTILHDVAVIRKVNRKKRFLEGTQEEEDS